MKTWLHTYGAPHTACENWSAILCDWVQLRCSTDSKSFGEERKNWADKEKDWEEKWNKKMVIATDDLWTLSRAFQGVQHSAWVNSFYGSIQSHAADYYIFVFHFFCRRGLSSSVITKSNKSRDYELFLQLTSILRLFTPKQHLSICVSEHRRQTARLCKSLRNSISCSSCKSILWAHTLFLLKHTLSWGQKKEMAATDNQITSNRTACFPSDLHVET